MTRTDYLDEADARCARLLAYLREHDRRQHGGTGLLGGAGYHLEQLQLDLEQVRRDRYRLRQELDRTALELTQARAERDELRRALERIGPERDMGFRLRSVLNGEAAE